MKSHPSPAGALQGPLLFSFGAGWDLGGGAWGGGGGSGLSTWGGGGAWVGSSATGLTGSVATGFGRAGAGLAGGLGLPGAA